MAGEIYIVATPIGNLADISARALEVLRRVDVILCEDTRVTKKLLSRYEISTPTRSFHAHSSPRVMREILSLIENGQNVALVTDAGTPCISDPGGKLVEAVYETIPDADIIPIPGASAVIADLSVCVYLSNNFTFVRFKHKKKERNKYFEQVAASPVTVAFYESNHRIKKTLGQLAEVLEPHRGVCIMRELTKKFEEVVRVEAR